MNAIVKYGFFYKEIKIEIHKYTNIYINNNYTGFLKDIILKSHKNKLILIIEKKWLQYTIDKKYKIKFNNREDYENFLETLQTCPICFLPIVKNYSDCEYCHNKFHKNCLDKWFQIKCTCPMCRISNKERPIENNY